MCFFSICFFFEAWKSQVYQTDQYWSCSLRFVDFYVSNKDLEVERLRLKLRCLNIFLLHGVFWVRIQNSCHPFQSQVGRISGFVDLSLFTSKNRFDSDPHPLWTWREKGNVFVFRKQFFPNKIHQNQNCRPGLPS